MSAETPTPSDKPFADRLVAAAKELGLPDKTEEVIRKADEFVSDAVASAGTFTEERREKISEFLDKAEHAIDERTDGKYADKVAKARAQAEKGIDKIAEQRRPATEGASAATSTYPTDPTGDASVGEEPDPSPGSPS